MTTLRSVLVINLTATPLVALALLMTALTSAPLHAQEAGSAATVPVHLVVTEDSKKKDVPPPPLDKRDVFVKQGKDRLQVVDWIPAKGEQGGLQLYLLIDDTCSTALGSHLDDLRDFITAQPATTLVAIGYMRNANVTVVQDFTADHAQAAKAIRLPLGSLSAQDSPYLALVSLLKRWPEGKVRREVVMVTDGIDRLGGYQPSGAYGRSGGFATMPYISPDVEIASNASQRTGVIVHSVYAPGVGRADRNFYEAQNGLNGLAKLSDESGGEAFFLSTGNPVSLQPYMETLQKILENQYFLVFLAKPGKKSGLQRVKLDSEIPEVELVAADNVWVPAPNEASKKKK